LAAALACYRQTLGGGVGGGGGGGGGFLKRHVHDIELVVDDSRSIFSFIGWKM
jgi:hypothetical protein